MTLFGFSFNEMLCIMAVALSGIMKIANTYFETDQIRDTESWLKAAA
ncbi:hypothetical protein Fuma_02916 [Fuerstiella marisgermanici]|uniref:Uncharacterized protein n=1 Tax=Fuerstiella marisgermanici TaxID=1891926 RepID=A0A1P8WGW0_9PLAN|nr:hypothetical protein Fuma_02916 [Fuerstiella marisgermanici]